MPDTLFPVTHSIPSASALLAQIGNNYDLGPLTECRYWQIGLNDTYMLFGKEHSYVLRVYRAHRRTSSDIEYELEALAQLSQKGVPVSTAIPRNDGRHFTALEAPEGRRYYVVFTYAQGSTFSYGSDIQIAFDYGKAIAHIHNTMDGFTSNHKRFDLNLDFLIHKPMALIKPYLIHRPTDWDYMCHLAKQIEENLLHLNSEGLDTGFCHGDTNGYNAHFTSNRQLIFFDFDFCGVGWRAFDLASFRWLALMNPTEERWKHFLQGYTVLRPLHEVDLSAVPYLVGARQIWIDSLQIENAPDWGFNDINDAYFDRKLKYLRNLEASYFGHQGLKDGIPQQI